MTEDTRALARRIRETARLTGSFTLRSGMVSDTYFDKYRFEADPPLLKAIGERLAPLIPAPTTVLAGLEMGNSSEAEVVQRIRNSNYADIFTDVHGESSFDNVEVAYQQMAQAIAAYEGPACQEALRVLADGADRDIRIVEGTE